MNSSRPSPGRRSPAGRAASPPRSRRASLPGWRGSTPRSCNGLGVAHRDVRVMVRERRRLDADALLEPLGAEVGAPGPRRDRDPHGIRLGRDAHRRRSHRTPAAAGSTIRACCRARSDLRRVELFLRAERDLHPEDLRRAEQPVGVIAQAEDRGPVGGLVRAHALEHAHAVVQRVRQHVRGGVAPRHHLAVVPDPAVAVRHRHGGVSFESSQSAILADNLAATRASRRLADPCRARSLRSGHGAPNTWRQNASTASRAPRGPCGIDARCAAPVQADLVLQPPIVAVGIRDRRGERVRNEPELAGERQQRDVAGVRGQRRDGRARARARGTGRRIRRPPCRPRRA